MLLVRNSIAAVRTDLDDGDGLLWIEISCYVGGGRTLVRNLLLAAW